MLHERADLNGSNVTHIVPQGATSHRKQLQLDEKNSGKLYWGVRSRGHAIMIRANLEDINIETLIARAKAEARSPGRQKMCVGIALDVEGGPTLLDSDGSDKRPGRSFAPISNSKGPKSCYREDIELLYGACHNRLTSN